jgi:hypothetical protein
VVAAQVAVSFLRILVLAVLVAALGAYIYLREIPQAEREAKKEKLVAVDKDAVTGVTLTYPDREIELRKDDKGWRVAKPVDAPADETVVNSLVGTVVDAEVQKTLDEMPKDLASFGLEQPTVTVRLALKDGSQSPAVAVGKNTAIGGKTYVRKGDEPKLYLTTSSIGFGLNKQVKDLRDKQVMTFKDEEVSRVDIKPADGPPVSLVRKDKDAWTVEPGDQPADPTEVRSYLSSLRATRAVDFPDDAPADLAKYGLASPRLAVTVTSGQDGAPAQALLIGGEKMEGTQKQVYAKRGDQPAVYALGEWSYKNLGKSAGQFRDKTVLGFDPARVGKAVVERKDGAGATLVRGESGWQVEAAEGKAEGEHDRELPGGRPRAPRRRHRRRARARPGGVRTRRARRARRPDRQGRRGDRHRPRGEARREVVRHARRHEHGLRGPRLHVRAPRQAAARFRRGPERDDVDDPRARRRDDAAARDGRRRRPRRRGRPRRRRSRLVARPETTSRVGTEGHVPFGGPRNRRVAAGEAGATNEVRPQLQQQPRIVRVLATHGMPVR